MSDKDEPTPPKVTKIDDAAASMDTSNQDAGQEEWLSEGVLTDDGYYDAAEQEQKQDQDQDQDQEQEGSNAGLTSQDDSTMNSLNDATADNTTHLDQTAEQNMTTDDTNMEEQTQDHNIEDNLQEEQTEDHSIEDNLQQLSESRTSAGPNLDSISEYLVRKPREQPVESDGEDAKQEEDDGNNTDELLEMLGDDNKPQKQKMKVLRTLNQRQLKVAMEEDASTSDEDEEDLMQGAKIKSIKVIKSAHNRKQASKKAEPEAHSDSDASIDGADMLKNMFKQRREHQAANRSTRQSAQSRNSNSLLRSDVTSAGKRTGDTPAKTGTKPVTSTPLKQYTNRQVKKTNQDKIPHKPEAHTAHTKKTLTEKNTHKAEAHSLTPAKKTDVEKKVEAQKKTKTASDSLKMEEVDSDQDASAWAASARATRAQRLQRPERMEEDLFSDEFTEPDEDDEDTFCNDMPSSESEDLEEWFALDVRAERAGDYIPLLGHKAYELLTEERRRVELKLSNLRGSIAELSTRSRIQGDQIDSARRTLAELDAQLTHS